MEFVDGADLSSRVGPHSNLRNAEESAALIRIIALALHYAHGLGIVHRDLKPRNILLSTPLATGGAPKLHRLTSLLQDHVHPWGTPKITDFGLAKVLRNVEGLTETGSHPGTLAYMAPEQLLGRVVDRRVDVWALGVILYELLTGRRPFVDADGNAVFAKIVSEVELSHDAYPRAINPQVPHDLETICLNCLAKDFRQRFESAGTLAADLENYLRGRPVSAARPGLWSRSIKFCKRNSLLTMLAAALSLILLLVAGFRYAQWRADAHSQALKKGFQDLHALASSSPEDNIAACLYLKAVVDPASSDRREFELAALIDLQLGFSKFRLGRNEDALRHLSDCIRSLVGGVAENGPNQTQHEAMLYVAYAARARVYERLMNESTALLPSAVPANTSQAVRGTSALAHAIVDLDLALSLPKSVGLEEVFEWTGVKVSREQAALARTLNLARLRPYLTRYREANNLSEAVELADILSECPALRAGEPHYDVACVYAEAFRKNTVSQRYAAAAVYHLRLAQRVGFGVDAVQGMAGRLPKATLLESIQTDRDFDGLRAHPEFKSFVESLANAPSNK
jgi:hypothetical protein